MAGAEKLLAELPEKLGRRARLARALHGRLRPRPVCAVGHVQTFQANAENVAAAVKNKPHAHALHPGKTFEQYRAEGGYALLKSCLDGSRPRERDHQGGGRFRFARPWRRRLSHRPQMALVRNEPAPRLFAVNADEGEPGTFKDRHYLRSTRIVSSKAC